MRKKIWVNKAKSFKEAEEFDILFWKRAGSAAKFAALWGMVKDFYKLKNIKNGNKLRLQRTIWRIEQI